MRITNGKYGSWPKYKIPGGAFNVTKLYRVAELFACLLLYFPEKRI